MNCPLCVDADLDATFHHGIEVDVCPRCKGIWLDRGELDRLLSGVAPAISSTPEKKDGSKNAAPKNGAKKKGKKKKSKGQLLADLLDDVLDL